MSSEEKAKASLEGCLKDSKSGSILRLSKSTYFGCPPSERAEEKAYKY